LQKQILLKQTFPPYDYSMRAMLLMLSAISAHHLAGGALLNLHSLVIFGSVVYFLTKLSHSKVNEGPGLAALILTVQSLTHFILGGGSGEIRMTLSHLLIGIIAYFVVAKLEDFFLAVVRKFLWTLPNARFEFAHKMLEVSDQPILFFKSQILGLEILRRGPPVKL
jgi:uncharacterized membrane protein (GlpM family)